MSESYFMVNSITYAVKGRDILKKNGFSAYTERNPNPKEGEGCGYRIKVTGDRYRAERILLENNIKIHRITGGGYA